MTLKTSQICANPKCVKAGEEQLIENFYKRPNRGTYKAKCKSCEKIIIRNYRSTIKGYMKQCLNSAQRRARLYNRSFSITLENIYDLFIKQDKKCAITGTLLGHSNDGEGKSPKNMSIDRIDSSKGYTLDNIQWVCVWVQIAKQDWNEDEFKIWLVDAAKFISEDKGLFASASSTKKKFVVSKEELHELVNIQKIPYTAIGAKYGVSDNAIRKRCKTLGVDLRKIK